MPQADDVHVIRIRRDGSLESLHDDALKLEMLGPREIRRASHVEFDEATQRWTVADAKTGEILYSHVSRARCLAWERAHFNTRLHRGYHPFALGLESGVNCATRRQP